MRKPTRNILSTLTAFAFLCGVTMAQEKTATCDMKQVVQAYPGMAGARSETIAVQQSYSQEVVARQAEARKLQQSIIAEQDPAKRQQLQRQLQQVTSAIQAPIGILYPRHTRLDHRLKLHRVQVPPLSVFIPLNVQASFLSTPYRPRLAYHFHFNTPLGNVHRDCLYPPGCFQPKRLLEKLGVSHPPIFSKPHQKSHAKSRSASYN